MVPHPAGPRRAARHRQCRGQCERPRRRPRPDEQGIGQRGVRDRRRHSDRQHVRKPVRTSERGHEHVLRLQHASGRRGRDGGSDARSTEFGRDDQRGHQTRHQPMEGLRPVPLCLRQLAVEQHAAGSHRSGPANRQYAVHPRVRRRSRRTDSQKPALALGRGLEAGHLAEPGHFCRGGRPLPADDDPRAPGARS